VKRSTAFVGISMIDLFGEVYRPYMYNSPLPYAGGKTLAINKIRHYFPKKLTSMVSPFFGSGKIEFNCTYNGVKVFGCDIYQDLINFWQQLQYDPNQVCDFIDKHLPVESQKQYHKLKATYQIINDEKEKAGVFWLIHRTSFSGIGFLAGYSTYNSRTYLIRNQVKRLRKFYNPNISFECCDFEVSLNRHPNEFAYLDPPYLLGYCDRLYGAKGNNTHATFDHERLCHVLKQRDNWILSYNNSQEIRDMYHGYRFEYPTWSWNMSNKSSNEILIINT